MKFFSATAAILATATVALAIPTERSTQDVWSPEVTFPTAGTELAVGQTYKVTWDTSDAPTQITNKIGAVILREGEQLTPLILAGGFQLTDGSVDVTIPWVFSGSDYSITLFGDSGNYSPTFSISGPSPFTAQ